MTFIVVVVDVVIVSGDCTWNEKESNKSITRFSDATKRNKIKTNIDKIKLFGCCCQLGCDFNLLIIPPFELLKKVGRSTRGKYKKL